MRCRVVPPYLLESMLRCEDAELAELAGHTLVLDVAFRTIRAARLPEGRSAPAPTAVPPGSAPDRAVSDARGGYQLPGTLVRAEGSPASGDAATDETYDALGATWSLLLEEYGRDSLDGAGEQLPATVHYGQRYQNAFWDGERIVLGDGDGVVLGRFSASDDVVAHELAHGLTERTAALAYRGQSGALNESVSDVLASLVRQRVRGQTTDAADWLIGADLLLPGVQGVGLRSMAAPGTAYDDPRLGRDPQPGTMSGYVETTGDNGGVHINSGIPNKAFHLAATAIGGHAWDRAGLVWYTTLVDPRLSPDADFTAFATLTSGVAGRLFGAGSAEQGAVHDAWRAVEVLP